MFLYVCPFSLFIETNILFKGEKQKEWARAIWIIVWTVALILIWRFSPFAAWFCVVMASIRLYEIYLTGVGTILNQRSMARARSVSTVVFYVIQSVFIFAILGQNLEHGGFRAESDEPPHEVATTAGEFLYIGWSNLLSLGNEFSATTSLGRFLEVFATTTGIFLLTVLLAFGIDQIKKKPDSTSQPASTS